MPSGQFRNLFQLISEKNYYYSIPQNQELLMYDFYMIAYLNALMKEGKFEPGTKRDPFGGEISTPTLSMGLRDSTRESFEEIKKQILDNLTPELLEAAYYSITCEFRHIFDRNTAESAYKDIAEINPHVAARPKFKQLLERYKGLVAKENALLDLNQKNSDYDFVRHIEKQKQRYNSKIIGKFDNKKYSVKDSSYDISYRVANILCKKLDISQAEFVGFSRDCFLHLKWNGSYGGEAWANICSAYLSLYNVKDRKNDEQKIIFIDNIYHQQHNTGSVFTKLQKFYNPSTKFGWIKKALDFKADVRDNWDRIKKIKQITGASGIHALRSIDKMFVEMLKATGDRSYAAYFGVDEKPKNLPDSSVASKKDTLISFDEYKNNASIIYTRFNSIITQLKGIVLSGINSYEKLSANSNVSQQQVSEIFRNTGKEYFNKLFSVPEFVIKTENMKKLSVSKLVIEKDNKKFYCVGFGFGIKLPTGNSILAEKGLTLKTFLQEIIANPSFKFKLYMGSSITDSNSFAEVEGTSALLHFVDELTWEQLMAAIGMSEKKKTPFKDLLNQIETKKQSSSSSNIPPLMWTPLNNIVNNQEQLAKSLSLPSEEIKAIAEKFKTALEKNSEAEKKKILKEYFLSLFKKYKEIIQVKDKNGDVWVSVGPGWKSELTYTEPSAKIVDIDLKQILKSSISDLTLRYISTGENMLTASGQSPILLYFVSKNDWDKITKIINSPDTSSSDKSANSFIKELNVSVDGFMNNMSYYTKTFSSNEDLINKLFEESKAAKGKEATKSLQKKWSEEYFTDLFSKNDTFKIKDENGQYYYCIGKGFRKQSSVSGTDGFSLREMIGDDVERASIRDFIKVAGAAPDVLYFVNETKWKTEPFFEKLYNKVKGGETASSSESSTEIEALTMEQYNSQKKQLLEKFKVNYEILAQYLAAEKQINGGREEKIQLIKTWAKTYMEDVFEKSDTFIVVDEYGNKYYCVGRGFVINGKSLTFDLGDLLDGYLLKITNSSFMSAAGLNNHLLYFVDEHTWTTSPIFQELYNEVKEGKTSSSSETPTQQPMTLSEFNAQVDQKFPDSSVDKKFDRFVARFKNASHDQMAYEIARFLYDYIQQAVLVKGKIQFSDAPEIVLYALCPGFLIHLSNKNDVVFHWNLNTAIQFLMGADSPVTYMYNNNYGSLSFWKGNGNMKDKVCFIEPEYFAALKRRVEKVLSEPQKTSNPVKDNSKDLLQKFRKYGKEQPLVNYTPTFSGDWGYTGSYIYVGPGYSTLKNDLSKLTGIEPSKLMMLYRNNQQYYPSKNITTHDSLAYYLRVVQWKSIFQI